MIQPLDWHKACLRNATHTASRLRSQIEALTEQLERSTKELTFYGMQIKEAEIAGRTGFDADKFMRKHRSKQ